MSVTAVGTIIARNFEPHARVLAESLARFHPDVTFYVLVPDELEPASTNESDLFRRLTLTDIAPLELPLLFRYDSKQVLTSKKASFIRHLLGRGHQSVIFLDADMLVLADLTDLFERVSGHAVSVTPHFSTIEFDSGRFEREHGLLLAGIYNAGFLGVTDCAEARDFLAWWDERLHEWCESDVRRGLHYDQRWLDMLPAYVEDLHVYCESDCNIAYWNLPDLETSVGDSPTDLRVWGKPCKIFHFSGFDPLDPGTLSRYDVDLGPATRSHLRPLLEHYAASLRRHGVDRTLDVPWRWDTFSNGVRIPECVRRVFASLDRAGASFADPFDASDAKGLYHWLREPVHTDERGPGPRISRLWLNLYEQSPDLQARFPKAAVSDCAAFIEWTTLHGLERFDLPRDFALAALPPGRGK